MKSAKLKTPEQIGFMREAGKITAGALQAVCEAAKPGGTPKQLDELAFTYIKDHGATPNFLGYCGYPATLCISVNDTVVHGIPDDTPLQDGDIVSFDGGCLLQREGQNWHSDSARSVIVGDLGKAPLERVQLNSLTEKAMWAGIEEMATAKRISYIGEAIENYVLAASRYFQWEPGIVEQFVGHGIGNRLHEDPEVHNFAIKGRTAKLQVGMVLCIEPILTVGETKTRTSADGWTEKTVSGKSAAHWEHTVALVAPGQIQVLTAP